MRESLGARGLADAEELFRILLEDLHRGFVLQLNDVRVVMDDIHDGRIAPERVADKVAEARAMLGPLARGLSARMPLLSRQLNKVIADCTNE